MAVAAEVALIGAFLGIPPIARLLGGGWPTYQGWLYAAGAAVVLIAGDTIQKLIARKVRRHGRTRSGTRRA